MAINKIEFPTSGAPTALIDYVKLLNNVSSNIKGHSPIPITEIGTTNTPLIADGSIFNAGGSLYIADSNTSITGTIGASRYIEMVPSGDTLVPTWTASVPTWNHANNHYESGGGNLVLSIFRGIDLVNSILTYNSYTTYENYKAYNFRQPIDVTSDTFQVDFTGPSSVVTSTTNVEPLCVIDVCRYSIKRLSYDIVILGASGTIDEYYLIGTTGSPFNKKYNDASNTILYSDISSYTMPKTYNTTYTASNLEAYDYLIIYVKTSATGSGAYINSIRQNYSPMPLGASVSIPFTSSISQFVQKNASRDELTLVRFT